MPTPKFSLLEVVFSSKTNDAKGGPFGNDISDDFQRRKSKRSGIFSKNTKGGPFGKNDDFRFFALDEQRKGGTL